MIHDLSQKNSLVSQFVSEIRDVNIQRDRMRFRRNMERLGEIFAYEISQQLEWKDTKITTPLGTAVCKTLAEQPVVGTILRAGLALHQGILNYFDKADNAFISAYRKHNPDGTFYINMGHFTCPPLTNRTVILSDPMLATGASLVLTVKEMLKQGKPKHIHIIAAIACTPGVEHVMQNLPDVTLWAGAIDKELNDKAYIVPGLGDAGDLAFGEKMQD